MPFNRDFDKGNEAIMLEASKLTGCFNWNCRRPNPTMRCGKCRVAFYCSRECQKADWKDEHDPHKQKCDGYCANTQAKHWKGGRGQEFPMAVGLLSVGQILDVDCWMQMEMRADACLGELERVGERKIGIVANVVYNFDRPILQCTVTFSNRAGMPHAETVYYVVFAPIGEGGAGARQRLHPPSGGPGNISKQCRKQAVVELKKFIKKANAEYGLTVDLFTYQRGLMWMSDKEFRKGGAKELIDANGGNRFTWNADQGYSMQRV